VGDELRFSTAPLYRELNSMASDRAIATVGRAIVGLMKDHCRADLARGADFELYGPQNFDNPMGYGVSLMLYRIAINASPRNRPPRMTATGNKMRPSLPLDLHYLLTVWASAVDTQHLMLGWAMRFLEDRGVLPAGVLNAYDAEPDTFGAGEGVELICDPLGLQDYLQIWDKLKTRMPLSVSYVARMVLLDSKLPMSAPAPVRTRDSSAGEGVVP